MIDPLAFLLRGSWFTCLTNYTEKYKAKRIFDCIISKHWQKFITFSTICKLFGDISQNVRVLVLKKMMRKINVVL